MYNSARMIGVTIGIIVGLILTIFVIRYVNRNKKLTTKYDEMQKQIRGEGYKYAFYAVLILEAVLCVLTLEGSIYRAEYKSAEVCNSYGHRFSVQSFQRVHGLEVRRAYCGWQVAGAHSQSAVRLDVCGDRYRRPCQKSD